jgi:hypothetical protein
MTRQLVPILQVVCDKRNTCTVYNPIKICSGVVNNVVELKVPEIDFLIQTLKLN